MIVLEKAWKDSRWPQDREQTTILVRNTKAGLDDLMAIRPDEIQTLDFWYHQLSA